MILGVVFATPFQIPPQYLSVHICLIVRCMSNTRVVLHRRLTRVYVRSFLKSVCGTKVTVSTNYALFRLLVTDYLEWLFNSFGLFSKE